jgi:NADPH:quinone reductase-like Zn-dependent oxidoreductase
MEGKGVGRFGKGAPGCTQLSPAPATSPTHRNTPQIGELVAAGKVKPVVDRVLPLEEVAAVHEYMETLRARGKVVLRVAADE